MQVCFWCSHCQWPASHKAKF